jgi:hypothetical protein
VRSTVLVIALLVAAPVVAGRTEASRAPGDPVLRAQQIQPAALATAHLSASAAVCATAEPATVLPWEGVSAAGMPNRCGDVERHPADVIQAPSDRSGRGVSTLASASCDYWYDKCLNATDNNQGLAACILYLWYCG